MATLDTLIHTRSDTQMFASLIDMVDANLPGADLASLLSGATAYTIFVPTDAALIGAAVALGYSGTSEDGALTYLVEVAMLLGKGDPWPVLYDLVAYHMVGGSLGTGDLAGATPMTTVEGSALSWTGTALADNDADSLDAPISGSEVADNGQLHLIQGTLLPTEILASNGADDVQLVVGSDSADTITTGADDDYINGKGGSDTIDAGAGDDTILGCCGNDTIFAGAGNDYAAGGNGRDIIYGGLGNDTLTGGNNDDIIFGGDGADVIDGGNDDDTLSGGDGADDIAGGNGDDTLSGDQGSDTLTGGAGQDLLDGGTGMDLLNGGQDNDTLTGGSGNDIFAFGYGAGYDTITDFSDGSDRIDVTDLDIYTLNQMTITQEGTSTLIVFNSGARVELLNTNATDIDASDFILAAPPVIIGTDAGEVLQLGDGDDTVDAGAGSDRVYGNGGDDDIQGGSGEDYIDGGDGNDTIDGGSGKDQVKGGDGNDTILGQASNDLLYGGNGNDLINGGADNDRLYGQGGADTLIGDHGNDRLYGGGGSDTLLGGAGKDKLNGGTGNDTLTGGFGQDILTGGSGIDTFVFETRSRADTITDFVNGQDLLDVSAFGFADIGGMTITQVGSDVLVAFNSRDMVTLLNTDIGDIDSSDFIF